MPPLCVVEAKWITPEVIRAQDRYEERGMPSIGPLELVIVLVIALLILGPKRLPDAGRSLGRGMREFKDSLTGRAEQPAELPDSEPAPARKS
jgi:sec-independent protein translocase protein TatA